MTKPNHNLTIIFGNESKQEIEKELMGEPRWLNAREGGATPVSPVQNVSPLPHTRNGYSNEKEPTVCAKSMCDDISMVEGAGLTTGPRIKCPDCGAEGKDIVIACYESSDMPAFCMKCQKVVVVN